MLYRLVSEFGEITFQVPQPANVGRPQAADQAVESVEKYFVTFFFFKLFTAVLPHWDFPHGKFRLLSPVKASCDKVILPNQRCMLGIFSVFS